MALGDVDGRRAAASAFPAVVRTGTHLFTAAKYTEQFRGWGPVARRAFASWYLGKDPDELAYQLVKYRGREDWTHLDVLRSAHSTKHADQAHRDLFNWLAKGVTERDPLPKWIEAYELVRGIERSGETLTARTRGYVQLIRDYPGLPWEALPDEATSQADVWRALVDAGMPVTALIRNLARLTRLGVLAPLSSHLAAVCARLRDQELLRKGRVHPVALLVAAKVYASGRAEKGSTTWVPVPQVTDALTDAFYLAFGAVEPSGKRVNLAVDISGSMASSAAGYCITAREMAAAMALVTAATEPRHVITAFTHGPYPSKWSGINGMGSGITPMPVSPRQRIDDVMRTAAAMTMGGTNCAVPMLEAARHRMPVDTFVLMTDNETWYGGIHPHEALENYRQVMGIDARLQVVAFTPTRFSVARPDDPRELDVSGFDASVPVLLADHSVQCGCRGNRRYRRKARGSQQGAVWSLPGQGRWRRALMRPGSAGHRCPPACR